MLPLPVPLEIQELPQDTWVHEAPDLESTRIGRVPGGSRVLVEEHLEGEGCEDWARIAPYGYACLDGGRPSELAPEPLPQVLRFDPPRPEEYGAYLEEGCWDRSELEELAPYIYGRRYRNWRAPIYESVAAFEAGEPPSDRLGSVRKFAFVDSLSSSEGEVLVREDGSVVPLEQVYVYPISRHEGRDLERHPLVEDYVAAWTLSYEGTALYDQPEGERIDELPFHTPLEVRLLDQGWAEVMGEGFVRQRELRIWVPAPAPSVVGEHELWVDIDRGSQMLALRRGEELLYLTLVSTGTPEGQHETPVGLFQIQRKYAAKDMSSGAGAEEPYYVEKVPWSMYFHGPYALHGVFWHWGFGRVASHGCVNLAPRDAHHLYDQLEPAMPLGWDFVRATPEHPGTLVRVREGRDLAMPDYRP